MFSLLLLNETKVRSKRRIQEKHHKLKKKTLTTYKETKRNAKTSHIDTGQNRAEQLKSNS